MISDGLLRQECLITPRTQTGADDDYGGPTWVDGIPAAARFHYEPISGEELINRPGFRATYRSWFHSATPIGVHSLVSAVTGQVWEVEGNPRRWINPRNGKSYIEADLVEVE